MRANDSDDPEYAPKIPSQVPEPFHRDGGVYEEKVEGWPHPGLAYKTRRPRPPYGPHRVKHSKRFRGVAEAVATPFQTIVLDGEVAILDQQLRSRLEWLRGAPDESHSPVHRWLDTGAGLGLVVAGGAIARYEALPGATS